MYGNGFILNLLFFVDFFFVLSGFVITYTYGNRIKNGMDVWTFVVKRFGRVWPLHAVLLAMIVAMEIGKALFSSHFGEMRVHQAFTGPTAPHTILTNILLMNSWGAETWGTWNVPSWSIGAEFYTYLIFAIASLVAGPKLPWVAGIIGLFGATIIFFFCPSYMETGFDYGFYRCLLGFFVGTLVYTTFKVRPFKAKRWATLWEMGALAIVLGFLSYSGPNPSSLLAPFVFGLVVYVFAGETGWVSTFLLKKMFTNLGLWSYSIYMVHFLLFALLVYGPVRALEKLTNTPYSVDVPFQGQITNSIWIGNSYLMDLILVLYLVAVVSVSALTYRWIEAPGRVYFNKLSHLSKFKRP